MDTEHEFRVTCPQCGRTISGDTERETIERFEDHVQEEHNLFLTDQKVKDMMRKQAEVSQVRDR